MTTLKGTAYFSKHLKPAPESTNKGVTFKRRYEISLGLDSDGEKTAKKMGLRINDPNNSIPTKWVKVTSDCPVDQDKEKDKKILEQRKPTVYYGKEPGYTGLIWNGSKVNLVGEVREYYGKPKFLWRAIQILELAPKPEGWEEPLDVESELEDVNPTASNNDLNDTLDDLP